MLAARECEPPGTQSLHRILRQRNDSQTAFCIPSSHNSRVDMALNSSAIHSGPHNDLTLRRDLFQPHQRDNPSRIHESRTRSRLDVAVQVHGLLQSSAWVACAWRTPIRARLLRPSHLSRQPVKPTLYYKVELIYAVQPRPPPVASS